MGLPPVAASWTGALLTANCQLPTARVLAPCHVRPTTTLSAALPARMAHADFPAGGMMFGKRAQPQGAGAGPAGGGGRGQGPGRGAAGRGSQQWGPAGRQVRQQQVGTGPHQHDVCQQDWRRLRSCSCYSCAIRFHGCVEWFLQPICCTWCCCCCCLAGRRACWCCTLAGHR
jgi:hypothetical protein